jgi:quinol monooxygenase YgiN
LSCAIGALKRFTDGRLEQRSIEMAARKTGLVVNGNLRVHPDDVQIFASMLGAHVEEMLRNPDVCYYSMGIDVSDPALIHLLEGWTSREALAVHNTSEEHRESIRQMSEKVRVIARDLRAYAVSGEERL